MKRSSTKKPPDPIFFTDRDLARTVPTLLRAGGMRVEAYHEHFELDNVADGEWLKFVGANGWIALSHNKKIRYEKDELDDLMTASVKAFFIIGKGPHAAYADAVLRNQRKILKMIERYPEPFVARVYQEQDDVKLWVSYEDWLRSRRSGK